MLELILGTSGTGKTTELLHRIRQRAQQGHYCLYLVPEQFSQSAELLLYDELGDRLSAFAEVVAGDFRELAEADHAVPLDLIAEGAVGVLDAAARGEGELRN